MKLDLKDVLNACPSLEAKYEASVPFKAGLVLRLSLLVYSFVSHLLD